MLSDEQIEALYAYCNRKNVRYYDLQVEIVDHMANAIEAKMQDNPAIAFKDALEEVHRSFGSFGLKDIVVEKTTAMRKHYRKWRLRMFMGYFKFPKIMLTALLVTVMISIERLVPDNALYNVLVVGLAGTIMVYGRLVWAKRGLRKQQKKQLLMTDNQHFEFVFPYVIAVQIVTRVFKSDFYAALNIGNELVFEYYFLGVGMIIFTLTSLSTFALVKTITEKAKMQYPAVFAQ